ncbi:hypothetical protein KYI92_14330 [Pantoea allii]|uniref:Colicin pore forming domain-containing protein n=1 Tax=Pantoea allii TaxID=574096 RepID=A0ABS6VG21_9GAMM|nr:MULTISPECIES: hypothetical protein [Pantoea]MBW1214636.1 hypothetical protein [Pantoea allii]MBW1258267.1 hypothetical protein [Pantoea allii]MBW1267488.1 hypothetical protein [Pantoea allii]MBW1289550.1 hypothetical protein [Pantoea allii]MDJ0091413.1 hypothetical protein [Pantoea allii]
MAGKSNVEPGFCVVQRPGRLTEQAMFLFGNRNFPAINYFLELNADVVWAKPGQMLIVADPNGNNNPTVINALNVAKKQTNNSLSTMSVEDANFFHRHYDSIAAITNFMDKGLGLIGDAGEKYFSEIGNKLKAIENAYRNQYLTAGTLIGEQFFIERRRLFNELEELLNRFSRLALRLRPYEQLKHALNLSSSSIVHDWQTAGVGAIRGYSTYVDAAAKAAKFMKYGGWVAIGFSALNTTNDVYKGCTVDREHECTKVAVKEYSRFAGSTLAGFYGGALSASLATGACVALGVATGGVGALACGIIGGAAGGYGFGEAGGKAVDIIMDKIL